MPVPSAEVGAMSGRLTGSQVRSEGARDVGQHPQQSPEPAKTLGVFERTAFFVNPDGGGPREILAGAASAGITMASFNFGDLGKWLTWPVPRGMAGSQWARCDTATRVLAIATGAYYSRSIANIESPEMTAGFCTPEHAVEVIGRGGAIITEATVPWANWKPVAEAGMPVFIEIDPNVPKVREVGVGELVKYGEHVSGCQVIPAFFVTANAWWDGDARTFETYWDQLRETWPAPKPFALYAAENTPDWNVIR